jgi:uncharacterized membrane protein YuzA (DUF378 family)
MFFALIVGFGQIVFAYNFFQTLKRKTKTSDEEQFGEDQIKRSVKEQNSYINEQGDIVNTELLLQGTEEVAKIIRTNEGAINKIVEDQRGRGHLFWRRTDTIHKQFYYAAAVSTGLAGILHLLLVQFFIGFDSNISIFFVVTGIAQLFWVIPLIRGWGKLWYILGSVVTAALIVSWVSTNAPLPVKELVAPYDIMYITIETSQVVFMAAAMSITVGEIQSKRKIEL